MIASSEISKKQQTLKSKVDFQGIGLHSGQKVNISIHPSEVNSGIKFFRTDLSRKFITLKNIYSVGTL